MLLLLCSCHNNYNKEDIVGTWESDEDHYVIHLYDNDSCEITNLSRNILYCKLYKEPWHSKEELNDTSRIEIHATWNIYDLEKNVIFDLDYKDWHCVSLNLNHYDFNLRVKKGVFFWRKSNWKLYYTTMDEQEYVEEHTFSRCEK